MSPLYDFKCPACGKVEEKIFKSGEGVPDYFYNQCCFKRSVRLIGIPAKRRDMTVVGDNKL